MTMLLAFAPPTQAAEWRSGVRNNTSTMTFASWRGTRLGVVSGWIEWNRPWPKLTLDDLPRNARGWVPLA